MRKKPFEQKITLMKWVLRKKLFEEMSHNLAEPKPETPSFPKLYSLHSSSKITGSNNVQTEKLPNEAGVPDQCKSNSSPLKDHHIIATYESNDNGENNLPCSITKAELNPQESSKGNTPTNQEKQREIKDKELKTIIS